MLDDDDRQRALQLADQLGQPFGRLRAEAGGRLVEEEQARLGGERNGDLERAPLAVGEVARARALVAREADARQHARRLLLGGRVGAQVAPGVEAAPAHVRQGDQDVVERRVVVEQVHHLERARDALAARRGAAAGR